MADYCSLNRVILVGNVVRDPEFKEGPKAKLCTFTLATNEIFRGRGEEPRPKVEYHNLIAWRKMAEVIYKYVRKGTLLCVEGRLRTNIYKKKEGEGNIYRAQIDLMSFSFLGKIREEKARVADAEAEGDAGDAMAEESEEPKKRGGRKRKKETNKDECPF